jgi:hypothetical protein
MAENDEMRREETTKIDGREQLKLPLSSKQGSQTCGPPDAFVRPAKKHLINLKK